MNTVIAFKRRGQHLYAIKDNTTGKFFAWCYTNGDFAIEVAGRLSSPVTHNDEANNWRTSVNHLITSSRERGYPRHATPAEEW